MISRWAPGAVAASGLAPRLRGRPSVDALGRFGAPVRHRTFWLALGAVVAAELVALMSIVFADEPVPGYRALFRLVGGAFVACGLIAWRRRPDSHTGLLMIATGFLLFVEPVFVQSRPARSDLGDVLEDPWGITIIALLLTFLTGGRLATRADRVLVGVFVVEHVLEVAATSSSSARATSCSSAPMRGSPSAVAARRSSSRSAASLSPS